MFAVYKKSIFYKLNKKAPLACGSDCVEGVDAVGAAVGVGGVSVTSGPSRLSSPTEPSWGKGEVFVESDGK